MSVESLRGRISPRLFAFLQANADRMTGERALNVLKEEFGVEPEEIVSEESGAAVFGASLVNFPRVSAKAAAGISGVVAAQLV